MPPGRQRCCAERKKIGTIAPGDAAVTSAMEKAGYFAGFYTSASAAKDLVSENIRTRYSFWCTQWGPACDFAGKCGMWQNTNKGFVAGVKGRVDTDYCYQDFPGIITKAGLNGYGKAAGYDPQRVKRKVRELYYK